MSQTLLKIEPQEAVQFGNSQFEGLAMSAEMRSGGIGVGCGSIYGAFERKEDARSRDRSSARTF